MSTDFPTLPENDAPPLPPDVTAEQAVLAKIAKEKTDELLTFVRTVMAANQVPAGQIPPVNPKLLIMAHDHVERAAFFFAHSFIGTNKNG